MGSIGASEILVILVVALLVLGPERLPEAARQVGRFLGEIRRIGSGLQAEMRDVLDAPTQMMDPQSSAATTPAAGATAATYAPGPGAPPAPSPGVEPPPPARPAPDVNGDVNA